MPGSDHTVSRRFFHAVHRHLASNFLDLEVRPPILGIFGPPGEGKTYQLERSIEACETEILWINAGDLESESAGQPARVIVDTLRDAAEQIAASKPTAVVLHDIDTTLGEWTDNTGTVNHQHVLAELMHFADRPKSPRYGEARIPVLITGNDAAKMYRPLMRARRMALFTWIPTPDERLEIVRHIFDNVSHQDASLLLAEAYPEHPIAFFADVAGAAMETLFERHPVANIIDMRLLLDARTRARLSSTVIQGELLGSGDILLLAETIAAQRRRSQVTYLGESYL